MNQVDGGRQGRVHSHAGVASRNHQPLGPGLGMHRIAIVAVVRPETHLLFERRSPGHVRCHLRGQEGAMQGGLMDEEEERRSGQEEGCRDRLRRGTQAAC